MRPEMTMTPEMRARLSVPVPRYTSYPTAPHFHDSVTGETYRGWLKALPANARLSLYLHVPFCDTLCWFCGCHTKITRQYAPVKAYAEAVLAEIATIGATVPPGAVVDHIHWGGGSPTILEPAEIDRVMGATRAAFTLSRDCEFAVEIDPRGLDDARIDALARNGLTRVSIGVQDFDEGVQKAINRVQTVAETKRVIDAFRAHGVKSLNIDAIYGLPGQTKEKLFATLDAVAALKPDRIALFGYAHVPWMKTHQKMIDEKALPGLDDRFIHAESAGDYLVSKGYERIGLDHFALPTDSMAIAARAGALKRNFQGYTVDPADALIGLGASSIGSLPQGYVQNAAPIAEYQRRVLAGALATEKGFALAEDDVARRAVIERLMCDMRFDRNDLLAHNDDIARDILNVADEVVRADDGLFVQSDADGFLVTDEGRPLLRTIAARFDAYLSGGKARHSSAV